ncbi:DHH family phosphoesterase [Natroniella sulfidigena]|uniref:DHH family phosphoesterase n=1 Tax=Natroniella sulfidigena TaxID=723921 RepID=UPI00200B4A33|nr:DHH family phosphoesterase [Natroniella sulfidigena]MCK8816864.1 DHH family phosphoesterase [Natroniella sulfidigena]
MIDLKELITDFDKVYIQPHDNPDADAIASAYGLERLIESWDQEAVIIYQGGEIKKPNLRNLIKEYRLKLMLVGAGFAIGDDELLVIVDGQYGAGNVSLVAAQNIIVIDHHLEEGNQKCLGKDIQPRIGACATMIVNYLREYGLEMDQELATVLYFGIYMDTDSFTGGMTVLDSDNKVFLEEYYDSEVFDYLRLSTLSFADIKTCAEGMLNTQRYENLVFSKMGDCGDNLLGHTSDLLSEINGVDIVVIYSAREQGFKFSVRSYHDYITAQELALELAAGVGSGGGHANKAGGFIITDKLQAAASNISFDMFVKTKVIDYCRNLVFLETAKDDPYQIYGEEAFFRAQKKSNYFRYLNIGDYFEENIRVKTLEGIEEASYEDKLIIGMKNEVWPIDEVKFKERYEIIDDQEVTAVSDRFVDDYGITLQSLDKTYRITKDNIKEHNICRSLDNNVVDVMQLEENMKIRTSWGDLFGRVGDYLLVIDLSDYYIIKEEIFDLSYEVL